MRFLKEGEHLVHPQILERLLLEQLRGYRWHPVPQHSFLLDRTAEVWASEQYGHSWLSLAGAYEHAGMPDAAARAREQGQLLMEGEWVAAP